MKKPPTLSERIDRYLETVPRSRPWFNTRTGEWEKGHVYISKRAIFAVFLEHRRARALQAMAELDEAIAREEAAERRRLRRHKARARAKAATKRRRNTH
jgi:hypothetical protein